MISCNKENSDNTKIDVDDVDPVFVICELNVLIENDNGVFSALVNGDAPPFTYKWSTGETTETISPTSGGEYGLTVTDAESCVDSSLILVNKCDLSNLMVGIDPTLNNDSTAWILVAEPAGGIPPYSYLWNSGERTQIIPLTFLAFVTVTDAENCEATNAIEIIDCLLYTSPSPRDATLSRMPSSA